MQNYYQLLQIGHLINQLTEKLRTVKEAVAECGRTLKSVWEDVTASIKKDGFYEFEIQQHLQQLKQLRY